MKKVSKKIIAAVFGVVVLSSCGSSSTTENEQNGVEVAEAEYVCPMRCEGDKTYEKEGECPVCHMELKKVE